jgi:hypothetical protein
MTAFEVYGRDGLAAVNRVMPADRLAVVRYRTAHPSLLDRFTRAPAFVLPAPTAIREGDRHA